MLMLSIFTTVLLGYVLIGVIMHGVAQIHFNDYTVWAMQPQAREHPDYQLAVDSLKEIATEEEACGPTAFRLIMICTWPAYAWSIVLSIWDLRRIKRETPA